MEYSYYGDVKVYYDKRNFGKSILIGCLIVLIPTFLTIFLAMDYEYCGECLFLVMLLSFVTFGLLAGKICGNNSTYLYINGRLFKVTHMPSEQEVAGLSNGLRGAGDLLGGDSSGGLSAGTAFIGLSSARSEEQELLVNNDEYKNFILDYGDTIKIIKVLKMEKYLSGYKFRFEYIRQGKNPKKMNWYIFPGYNDYEELIGHLKDLMD